MFLTIILILSFSIGPVFSVYFGNKQLPATLFEFMILINIMYIFSSILKVKKYKQNLKILNLTKLYFIFITFNSLSIINAYEPWGALANLLYRAECLLILFSVPFNIKDNKNLNYGFLAFSSLGAILGIITYVKLPPNITEAILLRKIDIGWIRSNALASLLLITLPYSLIIMISERHSLITKIIMSIVSAVTMMTIIITGSRSAILAIIMEFAFFLYYFLYIKRRKFKLNLITLFIFFVVIFILYIKFPVWEIIGWRFSSENIISRDLNTRIMIQEASYKLFTKHPLIGNGIASTGGIEYIRSGEVFQAHNYLLQTLAENGILGLISFLMFILYLTYILYQDLTKNKYNPNIYQYTFATLVMLIALLVQGLFENTFGTRWFDYLFYLAISIYISHYNFNKEVQSSPKTGHGDKVQNGLP